MKKLFSFAIFCVSMVVACLMAGVVATTAAGAASGLSEPPRTVFLISPKYIAKTTFGEFVYDDADNCLKSLNQDSSLSKSVEVASDVLDMASDGQKIYLLTANRISVFSPENGSTESLQISGNQLTQNLTKMSICAIDGQNYIIVYPTEISDQDKVLYGKISGNNVMLNKIEFTTNPSHNSSLVGGLSLVKLDDSIFLLRAAGSGLTSYSISSLSGDLSLSTLTVLETVGESDITNLDCDGQNKKVIATSVGQTTIYSANAIENSVSINLSKTISHSANVVDQVCNDSLVYVLFDSGYSCFNLDGDTQQSVQNPTCTVTDLDASQFKYYKLTERASVISAPDSSNLPDNATLEANSVVVEIASVKLSDNSDIVGYKYVMAEFNNHNVFGYIMSDENNLEELSKTQDQYTIKVTNNTKLFSLPSTHEDGKNTVIEQISGNLPVKVILSVDDYVLGTSTKMLMVEVGDKTGFIDAGRKLSDDKRIILAIPNAKLLSSTKVYEYSNKNSAVMHTLESGKRVRILEKRNSDGFVKIAYNDSEGNYFEGYIMADKIKSDSYSTLQIIGTVLVLLNCALLVILIITKRKVVK